jgi:hypothetical protein
MGEGKRHQREAKEGAVVAVSVELERVRKVLPRRRVVSGRVQNLYRAAPRAYVRRVGLRSAAWPWIQGTLPWIQV